MRLQSHYPNSTLNLRSAFTRWLAYKRAYSGSWQGFATPRLRRGLYKRAASQLASFSPRNATILDVGAGPGHLLIAIARQLPDATLRGIDIDPYIAQEARRLLDSVGLANLITIREADAAALPFEASTFDCVVSMMSYHLWDDPPAGLAEIQRVLKPGGALNLYVGRTQAYTGRWSFLEQFNHGTEKALRSALGSAGFESVDVKRTGTYVFTSAKR